MQVKKVSTVAAILALTLALPGCGALSARRVKRRPDVASARSHSSRSSLRRQSLKGVSRFGASRTSSGAQGLKRGATSSQPRHSASSSPAPSSRATGARAAHSGRERPRARVRAGARDEGGAVGAVLRLHADLAKDIEAAPQGRRIHKPHGRAQHAGLLHGLDPAPARGGR